MLLFRWQIVIIWHHYEISHYEMSKKCYVETLMPVIGNNLLIHNTEGLFIKDNISLLDTS